MKDMVVVYILNAVFVCFFFLGLLAYSEHSKRSL